MPKYIAILGSIMSGLGKGVLSASIGKMLKSSSYTVSMLKFDGYLNVDCGTMNPFRHGEVFVLSDGSEVDVDFGTYERFLDISLDGNSSLTGGKIFSSIIRKERKGDYLGRDVQFIPHVTDYIIEHIRRNASNSDISLIEVGGTVGDIENSYFIEALRQLSRKDDVLFIQLTHLPDLYGELKTKPTQQANKILLRMGITPHIIIARTNKEMDIETKKKIASYCNVEERDVFNDLEVGNVYELPLFLEKEGLHNALARHLKIDVKPQLQAWKERASRINRGKEVKIGVVGKYVKQVDSYASLREALVHAGTESNAVPIVEFIDAEDITEDKLRGYDGVIIPGGFGKRGIDGKMKAIEFARKNNVPLLGICLGMQLMVVEYARNVLGIDAVSEEFEDRGEKVVCLQPEQEGVKQLGGTLRLGDYELTIREGSILRDIYGGDKAVERHRHRYEVNPKFKSLLEEGGLRISAEHKGLVEAVEYSNGNGIGMQAHPEFTSRFEKPSPVFTWLVTKALSRASSS